MTDYLDRIICGDCLEVMRGLPDGCVDAVVTDPPYGLSFMGKDWDHGVPGEAFWREALRVAKPGAHLLAFGGTRTHHRLMCAIEDAGWEIRDCLGWLYGSGFPKSLDVSKAIDKASGDLLPRSVGFNVAGKSSGLGTIKRPELRSDNPKYQPYQPATPEAVRWQGWGTALKPAWEPIVLARKPLIGTVARNVLEHGTGALNIDGCRVGTEESLQRPERKGLGVSGGWANYKQEPGLYGTPKGLGRFPANLIHDGSAEVLDTFQKEGRSTKPSGTGGAFKATGAFPIASDPVKHADNGGSAARFFYCAKASASERGEGNNHPTVKPQALMRYLCRLVTPPGGVVLDPFAGSGSTLLAALKEGFRFIGIEQEEKYCEIARRRVAEATPSLFAAS